MSGSDEPQSCEYHVRASDGEDRFITWRGVALRDADNVATGVHALGRGHHRPAPRRERGASRARAHEQRVAARDHGRDGGGHLARAQPAARRHRQLRAGLRAAAARCRRPTCRRSPARSSRSPGQALRAGEIIRRIRSLVRNEDVRRELQDINELIREVHALLASDARVHDGRLELDLAPSLPRVTVDGVQIQQVLMNLVHNAFEAQGNETSRANADARPATARPSKCASPRAPPTAATSKCRSAISGRAWSATSNRRSSSHSSRPSPPARDSGSRSVDPSSRRTTRGWDIAPTSRAAPASTSCFRRTWRRRDERPAARRCSWSTTTTRCATRCACCSSRPGSPARRSRSAQEFLSRYDAAQPGCLVLDVRMPGMSGLEMQHELNLRGAMHPGDLHHRPRRHPDGGRGHAARRLRFPAEAVSRPGAARSRAARAGARHRESRAPAPHGPHPRTTRDAQPARTRSARPRDPGQGKQDGGGRSRREPAHRGDPPRARHAENGGRLAGRAGAHDDGCCASSHRSRARDRQKVRI